MLVLMCSTCGSRPATHGKACQVCVDRRKRYKAGLAAAHNRTRRTMQEAFDAVKTINELAAPVRTVPERERCSRVELNQRNRKILIAALNEPGAFGVRAMTEALGQTVSTKDLAEFIIDGLMIEEQQPAPKAGDPQPPRRFSLTDLGHQVAEDVKRFNPIAAGTGVTPEILLGLYERFAAGEGSDTRTQMELAARFGISIITVIARYKEWLAGEVTAMLTAEEPPTVVPEPVTEPPAEPEPAADNTTADVVATVPIPPGRIQGLKKEMLYARFDAGEGFDNESKARLGVLFGCEAGAIGAHLTDWRKARGLAGKAAPKVTGPAAAVKPVLQVTDPRRVHLCDTCLHRLVCRYMPADGDTNACEADNGPITIEYGPRPVTKCSGYHTEAAS